MFILLKEINLVAKNRHNPNLEGEREKSVIVHPFNAGVD